VPRALGGRLCERSQQRGARMAGWGGWSITQTPPLTSGRVAFGSSCGGKFTGLGATGCHLGHAVAWQSRRSGCVQDGIARASDRSPREATVRGGNSPVGRSACAGGPILSTPLRVWRQMSATTGDRCDRDT